MSRIIRSNFLCFHYSFTAVQVTPDNYAQYYISQATKLGNLLFVSGQVGAGEDGELKSKDDFSIQVDQAFLNLEKVLQAGGSNLTQIVKVTIFLTDMKNQFSFICQARKKYFTIPYPADTIVEVKSLYHPDVKVEIEAIAAIPK